MFDIGWAEMIVIGAVALLVIGPKELPQALRTFAHILRHMRKIAGEIQGGLNSLVREAELEEVRRKVNGATSNSIRAKLEQEILPVEDLNTAIETDLPDLKERIGVAAGADVPPPPVITPHPATPAS